MLNRETDVISEIILKLKNLTAYLPVHSRKKNALKTLLFNLVAIQIRLF